MQARTNGKLKEGAKNNVSTPEFGKGKVISHLRTLFQNTGMPMSPCKPVQSMCNIKSQMNIHELDFYWKQFNALILDAKLLWQASRLTMALKA